jgi:hypothetical protein
MKASSFIYISYYTYYVSCSSKDVHFLRVFFWQISIATLFEKATHVFNVLGEYSHCTEMFTDEEWLSRCIGKFWLDLQCFCHFIGYLQP